jgi:hypothetical protein
MLNKTNPSKSNRQRAALLKFVGQVEAYNLLIAKCQYKFLRLLGATHIGNPEFPKHTRPLTWANVRDFDRGWRTLYYRRSCRWHRCPIDDFSENPKAILTALDMVEHSYPDGHNLRYRAVFKMGHDVAGAARQRR